ncbi:hypothetical protein [Streptomyces sp. NPDC001054]
MANGVLVGRGYVSIRPEFEGNWNRSVSTRASSAGSSFSKAFGKAVSTGLKAVGGLAAVAVGSNLASAAAGAAALAPALATAGAAAGALKLGLSGVGDAFKAAFADSSAEASAAASATRAVEGAQRSLANAQKALADARVSAAERVKDAQKAVGDAERDLARTVEESAQRQKDAQQGVVDAERDLRDAQVDARQAQESLTDARKDATRSLEDMNARLADAQLDQREAVLRQAEAEKDLKAAQAKPGTKPEDLAKLQLAYDRATLNLKEQRTETARLTEDTKKANKAGIDGSAQVVAAQDRIASANDSVADKQRALAKAQEDARRTGVDGARAIADAQRDLADAQAGVDKARAEGQKQIEQAQQGVADAARALADAQAAAAAQTSALDQAMAKLAPNARAFVNAVTGLAPAWDAMKLSVQNALFQGLDGTVSTLANATIPVLQRQLTATAGVWNSIAKNAASAVTEMAKSGQLDKILAGATANLNAFAKTPGQLITAFGQLTVAAQPAFNAIAQQMAGAVTSFTDGIAKSFASGGLQQAITAAFGVLSQFGTLLGNVLGTVMQIMKAASDAGAEIVGVLGGVFAQLKTILATPEMQAQLRSLFTSVAQIVTAIVPVVTSVVQAIVPLMAAIAQPLAQLATVLGPVLQQVATALGAALLPVIQALAPVVVTVGTALVQLVQAVMPLVQPIATLIAALVSTLAPALTPVIDIVTRLVGVLVGPLTTIVTALTPTLAQIGALIASAFEQIEPLLQPILTVLAQIISFVAGAAVEAFQQLVAAIRPLISVGMNLVQTVFAALKPVLPVISEALGQVVQAVLTLLPPVANLVVSLAKQLAPVIAGLVPVIAQVAQILAGTLAAVIPVVAQVVVILVKALMPLAPLLAELVGQILGMAAGVLAQLLPALAELLTAFLPLLPPLAQLVGLVVQLAVKILDFLLPPLVTLVGYLVGALSKALALVVKGLTLVIGWVAKLVTAITKGLGPAFRWLGDKVVRPIWNGIKSVIATAWSNMKNNFASIKAGISAVGDRFRALRDKYVTPVWNGIKSTISSVYSRGIKPAFDRLKDALKSVSAGFDRAQAAIGKAWNKLKNATKGPVNFVINTVYTKGIKKVWDKVVGAFGGKPLPAAKGLARGGVLPGSSSFRQGDDQLVPMRRGEGVYVSEAMRDPYERARLFAVNKAAMHGRSLSPYQGGPGGFALGGIFDGIGDVASGAWKKIKKGASWLKDTFGGAVKAGVKKVVNPLINLIPGDGGFPGILKDAARELVDRLIGAGKKGDKEGVAHVNYKAGAGVEQWRPVVLQALREVHQPSSLAGSTLRRMNQESGGNPTVVNRWDSNWQAGHPSVGLMQVIGPTFRSYAGKYRKKGPFLYGTSVDPLANVYSSMRYALGSYGSLSRAYDRPGGYDQGGILGPGQVGVNHLRKPEAVLTPSQWNTMSSAASRDDGPVIVEIHARDEALADFIDVRVHRNQRDLLSAIRAS